MARKSVPINLRAALALLFVLNPATWAEQNAVMTPSSIEIFTSSDQPISGSDRLEEKHHSIDIHTHTLDAIRGLEDTLSRGLPASPDAAKRIVLQRVQRLNNGDRIQLEQSATALARAVPLGVEKYPAIVFDGELVVYGLTDLSVALMHYRSWQDGPR